MRQSYPPTTYCIVPFSHQSIQNNIFYSLNCLRLIYHGHFFIHPSFSFPTSVLTDFLKIHQENKKEHIFLKKEGAQFDLQYSSISSIYKWGNWCTKRWRHWHKVTVYVGAESRTQVYFIALSTLYYTTSLSISYTSWILSKKTSVSNMISNCPHKSLNYPGHSHLYHEKYILSTLKWNKKYLSESYFFVPKIQSLSL